MSHLSYVFDKSDVWKYVKLFDRMGNKSVCVQSRRSGIVMWGANPWVAKLILHGKRHMYDTYHRCMANPITEHLLSTINMIHNEYLYTYMDEDQMWFGEHTDKLPCFVDSDVDVAEERYEMLTDRMYKRTTSFTANVRQMTLILKQCKKISAVVILRLDGETLYVTAKNSHTSKEYTMPVKNVVGGDKTVAFTNRHLLTMLSWWPSERMFVKVKEGLPMLAIHHTDDAILVVGVKHRDVR